MKQSARAIIFFLGTKNPLKITLKRILTTLKTKKEVIELKALAYKLSSFRMFS
jgi:hypothetical protein